jgi:hypothetical protein
MKIMIILDQMNKNCYEFPYSPFLLNNNFFASNENIRIKWNS